MIKSGLGPHVVGQRVVVRRILRGETGPSGGPAMTDLLGICEAWSATTASVRAEDGTLVEIAVADIVSGKPVPPRPSRFSRLSADEVERRVAALIAEETEQLGDWVLCHATDIAARADVLLPVGDPGTDMASALAQVEASYAARGRVPSARVVVGSPGAAALEERGWVGPPREEPDTDVLLAGVAAVRRALAEVVVDPDAHGTRLSLDQDWALADLDSAGAEDGQAVLAGLAAAAAERGASVLVLHLPAGATATAERTLAEGAGFERHHTVRSLRPGP